MNHKIERGKVRRVVAALDNKSALSIRGLADRKHDEQRSELLAGEFNHRILNLLAMVHGLARQTQATSIEEYRAKLIARLSCLANVHKLIGSAKLERVRLADILEQTLDPFVALDERRVDLRGPEIALKPGLTLPLHLVFHELATNAYKYGALSTPLGWVKIRWELLDPNGASYQLAIVWSEHGGPEVKEPDHKGFGSRLFTEALKGKTRGVVELSFKRTGVTCRIVVDIDRWLCGRDNSTHEAA